MIKYDRLWELLRDMGLCNMDLLSILSAPTIAALTKNKYVKLTTIENLCKFLQCTPNDIMEIDITDMRHASWKEDGSETQFTGKFIVPAVKMMEESMAEGENRE